MKVKSSTEAKKVTSALKLPKKLFKEDLELQVQAAAPTKQGKKLLK